MGLRSSLAKPLPSQTAVVVTSIAVAATSAFAVVVVIVCESEILRASETEQRRDRDTP